MKITIAILDAQDRIIEYSKKAQAEWTAGCYAQDPIAKAVHSEKSRMFESMIKHEQELIKTLQTLYEVRP